MKIPELVFAERRPFFLYSENEIQASIRNARDLWQSYSRPGFEVYFSVKVNPNPNLLNLMSPLVDGFDVSSLAEAGLIRKLQLANPAIKMTWSGPAKTDRALDQVRHWDLRCFHLDSVEEFRQVQKRNRHMHCSLRIATPEIHTQKLGFSAAELEALRCQTNEPWRAVHSYLGRETFTPDSVKAFLARLQSLTEKGLFTRDAEVFLGAGLPSRFILEKHRTEFAPSEKPERILNLEAGRALIQSAGWYGTQILSLKSGQGKKNLIVDGGLQHLASHFLSPRYKAEGVEIRFFRDGVELFDREHTVGIHGSLSLWHDTMIDDVQAPANLRRGDWIVANNVGAYGYSAASNQFLGPSKIKEWLLKADGSMQDVSPPHLQSYHEAAR
jgi:diaminopimelate decarboxylase